VLSVAHFETHLTVGADVDHDRLLRWADQRGVKVVRILLDRGRHADQPMLTWHGPGTFDDAVAAARATGVELHRDGFDVVRVKVEGAPSAFDTVGRAPGRYFEHHVKLVLDPTTMLEPLRALSGRHSAHLSRNARRVRADGRREQFVTQRCHDGDRHDAAAALEALLAALRHYEIAEVEQEYVLLDDNPAWDAGWIEAR
jgi:hypothetical protein